jgi:hypothetical protein
MNFFSYIHSSQKSKNYLHLLPIPKSPCFGVSLCSVMLGSMDERARRGASTTQLQDLGREMSFQNFPTIGTQQGNACETEKK